MHTRVAVLIALFCVASTGSAQHLVFDGGSSQFSEIQASSAISPGGGNTVGSFPAQFSLSLALGGVGDISIDGATGLLWHSDGSLIAAEPHPAYPAFTAGSTVVPPTPVPFAAAGLTSPLYGLAIDSAAGSLWVTDGTRVAELGASPALPVITPAFVFPGSPFVIFSPPFKGLDWDPITSSLWGIDAVGVAWNFLPDGTLVGQPVPSAASQPVGIAIDKTGLPAGARPLYVMSQFLVSPPQFVDYTSGTSLSTPLLAANPRGIAFHALPSAALAASDLCPCPGMPFDLQFSGPMTTANNAFSVEITGLLPGTPVYFAFDFLGFDATFPTVNAVGCPLGMTLAGVFGFGATAGANGIASVPFSLATAPLGSSVYMQQILGCPSDLAMGGIGLVLTPTRQVIVCAP